MVITLSESLWYLTVDPVSATCMALVAIVVAVMLTFVVVALRRPSALGWLEKTVKALGGLARAVRKPNK